MRTYILQNIDNFVYPYKPDILVQIDDKYALVVECKSYTENAMFKRILVDFSLVKHIFPDINFVLFQLESQLGGDYSKLGEVTYGSPSTHTLMSYFNVDIEIITLLKGERKVDKPIHKPQYYKPLTIESLENALQVFVSILSKYIS